MMGIRLYKEPHIEDPVLIAAWPGIGNIGTIAVDTLRGMLDAEELGEIEPWDFFYPSRAIIRAGELKEMEFPNSKFFYKRTAKRDLLFFLGEEQPAEGAGAYATGAKAYRMANLVLDVVQRFGGRRVYTSGAAVAPIHHTVRPSVWAVPNSEDLIGEVRSYKNTLLMSDVEGRGGQGAISGLNGLLLGAARKRGLEAVCLMGEIPVYLHGFPIPYPKAAASVLEVLTAVLGIEVDMERMEMLVRQGERQVQALYESFPAQIREQLDRLKDVARARPPEPGPLTEEDKKKILDDIDKFFKRGPEGGLG